MKTRKQKTTSDIFYILEVKFTGKDRPPFTSKAEKSVRKVLKNAIQNAIDNLPYDSEFTLECDSQGEFVDGRNIISERRNVCLG